MWGKFTALLGEKDCNSGERLGILTRSGMRVVKTFPTFPLSPPSASNSRQRTEIIVAPAMIKDTQPEAFASQHELHYTRFTPQRTGRMSLSQEPKVGSYPLIMRCMDTLGRQTGGGTQPATHWHAKQYQQI